MALGDGVDRINITARTEIFELATRQVPNACHVNASFALALDPLSPLSVLLTPHFQYLVSNRIASRLFFFAATSTASMFFTMARVAAVVRTQGGV